MLNDIIKCLKYLNDKELALLALNVSFVLAERGNKIKNFINEKRNEDEK